MMTSRAVTVFGGTGFLGRRVVHHLLDRGFDVRVASRHPERVAQAFPNRSSGLEPVLADVGNDESVIHAVAGGFAVVNAVSLYVERGSATFKSVHVEAAARVAKFSREAGVQRLAHVSGIGADPQSHSSYIRSRADGESAVRTAFSEATFIRPAVMFGPDDAFLIHLMKMLRMLPVFPMFGHGQTLLQPAYVEDVGEAIARCFDAPEPEAIYELAGPNTYTYEELLKTMCNYLGIRRVLAPMPISFWKMLAFAAEYLPAPPIALNQVELMTKDNIASAGYPGFRTLGIEPTGIEIVLAAARRGEST
jgi:uncharacterized protein YbjT (DUF2867 family)